MGSYVTRRLLLMILTLFGMSVLIFVMMRLVPGNIADILVNASGSDDPKEKAQIARDLGIDRPIIEQYGKWIGGLARGDLGFAYVSERPAIEEIAPRIPITAKLAGLALLFSVLIGVPLGVMSAVRQNTKLDYALRVLSLSGLSLPSFWLGLLVLMASVHWFGVIPIYSNEPRGFFQELGLFAIPAATVGFRSSALIMRLTRSSMLEVLRQDYIRTARSKGASYMTVNFNHALRNALLPVITIIGIEAAFLVGGLIVTETVFNIPGVARFLVEAILWRDYPIVQNLVMLIAFVVVMVNFLVDMAYMALDPRIKFAD
jgi:peptide/nickel transport system permease protein